MNMLNLLAKALENNVTDIHITAGSPPVFRVNGKLERYGDIDLTPDDTKELVKQLTKDAYMREINQKGQVDMAFSEPGLGRFRINIYKQRGSYSIALRVIPFEIPVMEELNLPPIVRQLAMLPRGLILVTGPTGSGKTTTLASMVDMINQTKACHILTLEDPIEYLHKHKKSIVNQREINTDTISFSDALRSALRQDPDVILVGEMRDLETIRIALTAAETGHLVLSTLHTLGGARSIDRIIDVFPSSQQHQVRTQLAAVIQGIISQQLILKADGTGRVAAFEIMLGTPAIKNLIRENKLHQIDAVIETSILSGMQTMDRALADLYEAGLIDMEAVLRQAMMPNVVKKYIGKERVVGDFQV